MLNCKSLFKLQRRFFCKEVFTDYSDMIIDVSETSFKGSLIVCPTPIGNINDISIRQYEALTGGDVIATENVIKTSRLYHLIEKKKMKERFSSEFGITLEEFLNKGGMTMSEDKIVDEFVNINTENMNFYDFYKTEQDAQKTREFNSRDYSKPLNSEKETEEQPKKEENFDFSKNVYEFVKDSNDYFEKQKILKESKEQMRSYIDPLADKYDEKLKLAHKLRRKAKFILGLEKKKEFEEEEDVDKEEQIDLEYEFYSMSDNQIGNLKKKIREMKQNKGRGILVSFNKDNENVRAEKLIGAMRLGLKVVLVSLAGTPLVSDPGQTLVEKVLKAGMRIEALPGPSAVTTAISACGLNTKEFCFVGFLPRSKELKERKVREIFNSGKTTVLFENPQRLVRTLEMIEYVFGREHRIYVGSELSKIHETHRHSSVGELIEEFEKMDKVKGEYTIVVSGVKVESKVKDSEIDKYAEELASLEVSDKDFRDVLVKLFGVHRKKATVLLEKYRYNKKLSETDRIFTGKEGNKY